MPGALKAKVNGNWVLASSASGGGGAEEVSVGSSDPGAGYDIWIDTDEPAVLTDDQRWNTAWGVVASTEAATNLTFGPANSILASVGFTAVAGRAYSAHYEAVANFTYGSSITLHVQMRLDGTGGTVLAESRSNPVVNAQVTIHALCNRFVPSAGNHTVYTYYQFPATDNSITIQGSWSPWRLVISDVGPVTGSTAAPMATTDRWNTAWGIIGVGSFIGGAAYTVPAAMTSITNQLTVVTVTGRRYRMKLQVRVISATTGSGVNFLPRGPGVTATSQDIWASASPGYGYVSVEALFVGQGSSGAYYWDANPTTPNAMYFDTMSYFYIEDIGPVSGALAIADPTPPWLPFPFAANWQNYLNTYTACGYRKLGDVVYLRGLAQLNAGATSLIGTLPVGYRPPGASIFNLQCAGGALRTDINANGTVNNTAIALTPGNWVSLEAINFSVTPP